MAQLQPKQTQQPRPPAAGVSIVRDLGDALRIAEVTNRLNPGPTLMKILVGLEMGFGPGASLTNVHQITTRDGTSYTVGAHLMAAAIRSSGRYDYRVLERTPERCSVEFTRRLPDGTWEVQGGGPVTVTMAEAEKKGWSHVYGNDGKRRLKKFWDTVPENMLFARAVSTGYRTFCPDLSGGANVYDPDELDAVTVEVVQVQQPQERQALPAPATPPDRNGTPPAPANRPTEEQLLALKTARDELFAKSGLTSPTLRDAAWKDALAKRNVTTARDLTLEQFEELLKGINYKITCAEMQAKLGDVPPAPTPAAQGF